MNYEALKTAAINAAEKAYAPYSSFRVGAALLCEDGTIVDGCNVENRSYGLTICAERSAAVKAISLGYSRFTALAIYSPDNHEPLPPCGACRQVVSEFCDGKMPVLLGGSEGRWHTTTMGELLPLDSLHDRFF